jgi:hypothetical protein
MAVREQAKALFVCAIIGPLCCIYWQSAWPMVVMRRDVMMEVCFWRWAMSTIDIGVAQTKKGWRLLRISAGY